LTHVEGAKNLQGKQTNKLLEQADIIRETD